MNLEGVMLSEISRERDKHYMIYKWNLKIKISKQNRNRLIDTENKLMVIGW